MNVKTYIVIFLSVGLKSVLAQQQTVYTNYLLNQYLYNPAYAGVHQGTEFNAGYRNQWVGFDGAPVSFNASGYGTLKKQPNMQAGGYVTTEKLGLLQRTTFGGTYTYHLKINKKADINFGLGLGAIQHKVRVYDSKPYDKDDAYLSSDVLNAFAFDASAGFYFYTKNFFLGFSTQQMPNSTIKWENSIGKNTSHYYSYVGYNISIDKKKEWVIQPSVLLRNNVPAPYQLEAHLRTIFKKLVWLGFSYRQYSSASVMFGCTISDQFTFAYAYDFTLSELNNYSSGSHEIQLSYFIPFKKKKTKAELVKDADEEELNKIDNTLKTNLRNNKKKKETEEKKEPEPEKVKEPDTSVPPSEEQKTQQTESPVETPQSETETIKLESETQKVESETQKEAEPKH